VRSDLELGALEHCLAEEQLRATQGRGSGATEPGGDAARLRGGGEQQRGPVESENRPATDDLPERHALVASRDQYELTEVLGGLDVSDRVVALDDGCGTSQHPTNAVADLEPGANVDS